MRVSFHALNFFFLIIFSEYLDLIWQGREVGIPVDACYHTLCIPISSFCWSVCENISLIILACPFSCHSIEKYHLCVELIWQNQNHREWSIWVYVFQIYELCICIFKYKFQLCKWRVRHKKIITTVQLMRIFTRW